MLDKAILYDLRQSYEKMDAEGKLLSRTQLATYYETFRRRFGPEELENLDGEALLKKLHGPGNDSLVYWLEFKNDEEFPHRRFGSIAGGSALKFGIYFRSETQSWRTGAPSSQRDIPVEEAIAYARRHRDQLVRGVQLVQAVPANGTDEDYLALQKAMDEEAPDLSDLAWGHKYFSLLCPDKLDDYHVATYARYHLIKLLQVPPKGEGRYTAAGRYVAIGDELGIPLQNLTQILNERDGERHYYWRVGTSDGSNPRNRWPLMRDGGFVAIGWPKLGDLSDYATGQESLQALKQLMAQEYPSSPQHAGREGSEVYNFVRNLATRDLVLASDGGKVLGVGRVIEWYEYEPSSEFPHRRRVEWLSKEEWPLPLEEGLQTTVYRMRKYPENLVETERKILGATPVPPPGGRGALGSVPGRIQEVLERKKQVVLYGPPGTGKTYWAEVAARQLAARHSFGASYDQLTPEQKKLLDGDDTSTKGFIRNCTFHPAYGYEDFLEGYRPEVLDDQLVFSPHDGIFKVLCDDAREQPEQNFYLIIDEINRGDIPRIFGELLTVLEKDKRGRPVTLPVTGDSLRVPDNVYVIGTMNTADRSIALLDTALRRRFGFVELMPDSSVMGDTVVGGIPLGPWLDAVNRGIVDHVGQDARNLQIGHSYLLEAGRPIADLATLAKVLRDDIIPLLEEYCYEDFSALEKILGDGLVDVRNQQIRHELLNASKQDELVQALMTPYPELSTSPQVIAAEIEAPVDDSDEEEGTNGGDNPPAER